MWQNWLWSSGSRVQCVSQTVKKAGYFAMPSCWSSWLPLIILNCKLTELVDYLQSTSVLQLNAEKMRLLKKEKCLENSKPIVLSAFMHACKCLLVNTKSGCASSLPCPRHPYHLFGRFSEDMLLLLQYTGGKTK